MAEIKGKETATIQQVKEVKETTHKPKGKKKKLPSDSPNLRNKEVPLPETTKITEEEPPRTTDTDKIIEHQETLAAITNTKKTMEMLLFLLFYTLFHLIYISFPQCADAIIVYHYVLHYIINPESNLALSSCLHRTLAV